MDCMWAESLDKNQPRDVGYVLGALIVENYFKQSPNIRKTVSEILEITYYNNFIEKSRYSEKFNY